MQSTLVLGASLNSDRISFTAVERLVSSGHTVIAAGRRRGMIGDTPVVEIMPELEPGQIDTVTLYLNAANQQPLEDAILRLKPRRIIFNPGAENPSLQARAESAGIRCENACTLVMLSLGAY